MNSNTRLSISRFVEHSRGQAWRYSENTSQTRCSMDTTPWPRSNSVAILSNEFHEIEPTVSTWNVEEKRRMTPTKRRNSKPIESRLMTLEIGQHRRHLFYVNTRISHHTRKHIRVERNTRGGPRSSSQREKPTNLVKPH